MVILMTFVFPRIQDFNTEGAETGRGIQGPGGRRQDDGERGETEDLHEEHYSISKKVVAVLWAEKMP